MTAENGTTRNGSSGPGPASPVPSDPAAIEALIAERRAVLASTIDELVVRAHPKEIARRSAADARIRVRSFALTDDGELRTERMATVAAAGVAVLGLIRLLSRRRRC